MSTTTEVERRLDERDVATNPTVDVAVPDHVPAALAAEHPDAAAVVAAPARRPARVRVVQRPRRRSPARLVLALAACLVVAGFAAAGSVSTGTTGQATTSGRATAAGAPAASSDVPSCWAAFPSVLNGCVAGR